MLTDKEITYFEDQLPKDVKVIRDYTSFLETFFEASTMIQDAVNLEFKEYPGFIHKGFNKECHNGGVGFKWEFAKSLVEEFHNTYLNTKWGIELDWLETLEEFVNSKIKGLEV